MAISVYTLYIHKTAKAKRLIDAHDVRAGLQT